MHVSRELVEQHIHGAFGIDFMKCTENELIFCSEELVKYGVGAFFPTIMTDSLDVIKERIQVVKSAMAKQPVKSAKIVGVHLEGPFINPEKSGIHEKTYIQPLNIEIYKQIEDDVIKIITLAPELDYDGSFVKYLKSKDIKLSLGHSTGYDLTNMNQVTHLYNAMGAFSHRGKSSCVSALINDDIYAEIIADSMHVSDDVLKMTFRQKPVEKVLLISDALPLSHSDRAEQIFAGQKIYNKDGKLVNSEGVFAGSSMLLADIVKNLVDKQILTIKQALCASSENQLQYHNIQNKINVYWNDDNSIEKVEFI